jgi:hypothetical protein
LSFLFEVGELLTSLLDDELLGNDAGKSGIASDCLRELGRYQQAAEATEMITVFTSEIVAAMADVDFCTSPATLCN